MLLNVLFLTLALHAPSLQTNTVLFADNFDNGEESAIYKYLTAHGLDVYIDTNTDKKSSHHGNRGLKVRYVSIFKGSARVKGFFPLAKKVSEASLSYDVQFNDDFQFVKGGKLHGLGPDEVISGGRKMKPHGWSSRVMWWQDGKLHSYLYCQNKKTPYGDVRENDSFRFQKGTYYAVTLYTKLNSSADKADGEARIYVDGRLMVNHPNVHFWSDPNKDSRISQFLFTTFHGGGSEDWAPKDKNGKHVDVHATFDNFLVSEGLVIRQGPQ